MIFVYSRVSYLTYVSLQISCRVPLMMTYSVNYGYAATDYQSHSDHTPGPLPSTRAPCLFSLAAHNFNGQYPVRPSFQRLRVRQVYCLMMVKFPER